MTGIQNWLNIEVERTQQDETNNTHFETLAKAVVKEMEIQNNTSPRGKNLRVTDICNPMQYYYDIQTPNLLDPSDLQEKFDYGKFVETRVRNILSREKGFVVFQGNVDGSKCDMADVKGKIDFRINDGIIEFKTSEYDIPDTNTLYSRNPQDLEQLLLYALFTERSNREHFLLYLTGRYPSLTPREFKIKITNRDKLIQYFKERRDRIANAVVTKNPEGLGRCRYFTPTCKFKGVCNCNNENEIDLTVIKDNVRVTAVQGDLCDKLTKINFGQDYRNTFGLWDIFSPRRWILNNSQPFIYSEWAEDSKESYYLRRGIEAKFVDEGLLVNEPMSEELPEMKYGLFWINPGKNDANNESESKKYPFLVRVTDNTPRKSSYLNEAHTDQLGLACALGDTEIGYLFVFYRDSNASVLYKVKFNKLGKVKKMAEEIIMRSIKSLEGNKLNSTLPFCPNFVKKTCSVGCLCASEAE